MTVPGTSAEADGKNQFSRKFNELGTFAQSKDGTSWITQAMSLAYEASLRNKPRTAIQIYTECIKVAQTEWGPAEHSTLEFRRARANQRLQLKKVKDADDEYQEIVALAEQKIATSSATERAEFRQCIELVAEARIELAKTLFNKEDYDAAATINNDNSKICRRVLGPDHKWTVKAKTARTACLQRKDEIQKEKDKVAEKKDSTTRPTTSHNIAALPSVKSKKEAEQAPKVPTLKVSEVPDRASDTPIENRRSSTGNNNNDYIASKPQQPAAKESTGKTKDSLSPNSGKTKSNRSHSAGEAEIRRSLPDGDKSSSAKDVKPTSSPKKEDGSPKGRQSPRTPTTAQELEVKATTRQHNSSHSDTERPNPSSSRLPSEKETATSKDNPPKPSSVRKSRSADLNQDSGTSKVVDSKVNSDNGDNRGRSSEAIPKTTDRLQQTSAKESATTTTTTTTNKKDKGQALAKSETESHPSDVWLGDNLKASHRLFVRENDDEFSQNAHKYKRRVRIAILDTGIDVDHKDVKKKLKRVLEMKSFIENATNPNDCTDQDGHGTHLAMLINKVAPKADIYIARVFAKSWGGDHSSVAKAINHAVDKKKWDVDIICMSFGFSWEPPDIRQAVLNAALHNKLMFAAATNEGGNVKQAMYPARDPNVFCIHATNGDGTWASFNTKFSDVDYSTLGVQVKSAAAACCFPPPTTSSASTEPQSANSKTQRRDGTSVATAVAAGMAALILEFARMPVLQGEYWSPLDDDEMDQVHTIAGMKRVLDDICFTDIFTNKNKYIAPWHLITLDRCPENKEKAISKCLKKLSTTLGV